MYPKIGMCNNYEKGAIIVLGCESQKAAYDMKTYDAANFIAQLACMYGNKDEDDIIIFQNVLDNGGEDILIDLSDQLNEKIKLLYIDFIDGWEFVEYEMELNKNEKVNT